LGELVILLLAMGVMDTGGASLKSALREHLMQFGKRVHGRLRRAKIHTRAGGGVKHPGGHHDDDTGVNLNVDNLAGCSLLAVLTSHSTSIQRVPAVEDLHFLPDMGRMTL
jgi:hypothetical protein